MMSAKRDPIQIEILDPILLRVAALAQERSVDAYVVGGYVRDAVMGRARTDIDITVVGDPLEFA
jgi:poly(A) polymerase